MIHLQFEAQAVPRTMGAEEATWLLCESVPKELIVVLSLLRTEGCYSQ